MSSARHKIKYQKFFTELGQRIRKLRERDAYSQEDMMSYGWSLNHWQQIEGGRPISLRTLLRICEVFAVPMDQLVQGLDDYIVGYRSSDDPRGARRSRRQSAG